MAKITREQVAENRHALLAASGRLFRERGIDGVGINDLCEAAGFTSGALYSRFGSKDVLAAEAFQYGRQASNAKREKAVGMAPALPDMLDFYMSGKHRDDFSDCCPVLASSSEAARQSTAFKQAYADAFTDLGRAIGAGFASEQQAADVDADDATIMVLAASMVGVVSVARALAGTDPAASDALLEKARAIMGRLALPAAPSSPTAETGI